MRSICGENLSARLFQRGDVYVRHSIEKRASVSVFFAAKTTFENLFRRIQPRLLIVLRELLHKNIRIFGVQKSEYPVTQTTIDSSPRGVYGFDFLCCVFYVFVFMFYQKASDPEASLRKRTEREEVDVDPFCLRVPLSFCLHMNGSI